jgi:hypothetical protein
MTTASTTKRVSRGKARPTPVLSRDGLCLCIPVSACTHQGFRDWVKSDEFPEKLRVTFVDNEIYIDLSKEELETHAIVKSEVYRVLLNLNHDRKLGKFYLDGVLISNVAAAVSNNADGTFLLKSSIKSGRVRLVPHEKKQGQYLEIEGIPDWVMEIMSDSFVGKDARKLMIAYHQAGIPEYWLIDARKQDVIFQIYHWHKDGYVAAPERDGRQQSLIFSCWFRLVREKDDLGLWEYTLETRPD